MEKSQISILHEIMHHENALLVYVGSFSQETVKSMLKYAESRLEGTGVNDQVRKKLFNVMTEMLQNITKHQKDSKSETEEVAVFVLGQSKSGFYLVTGNNAGTEIIENISEKLDFINNLSKEELKEYYKRARLSSTISEVGGAGLGFIDIVRKSENPIEYLFLPASLSSAFFILKATITNTNI